MSDARKEIFTADLLCPLCNIQLAQNNGFKYIHREHIPPKSFFKNEQKINLITVPSCFECNQGSSKNDSKFKSYLGLYLGRNAPQFWESTIRSFNENKKHKREVLNNSTKEMIPFKGEDHRFRVVVPFEDRQVIKKGIEKIVRGLQWYITNSAIPSQARILIKLIKQEEFLDPDLKEILDAHGKWINLNSGAFECQHAITIDHPYASLWFLRFYGEDCFFVIVN